MEDVFLSYKREDIERASDVAEGLRAEGLSVFFDPHLEIGDYWEEVLEEKADAAKAVVPVWSTLSVKSPAVRSEAWHGLNRRKLAPIRIDDCKLPMFFDAVETADLRNWRSGNHHHYEWRRLVRGITRLGAAGSTISKTQPPSPTLNAVGAQMLLPLAASMPPPINGNAYDELKHSSVTLAQSDSVDLVSYRYTAGRGEPWALHMLGIMYLFGIGVDVDYGRALESFRAAAGARPARTCRDNPSARRHATTRDASRPCPS
ncbi:MAG: toll/interleukin-1 receptor domain-containing protein [Rhodospirillales bacterium]|nr:toll/interleukin-1 receptor domain-containing protein [Rhodospirillales bacterium]